MVEPEQAPRTGRNESLEERMDRNWMELIQELRVLQTGVQILGGFLLTLPFQERFEELDDWQRSLYLFNVMVAALTTVLIVLPVSVHRRLFRRGLKATLVSSADVVTKWALGGVALLIVGSATLVFDFVAGRTAGIVAASFIILVLLLLVVGAPLWLHRRAVRNGHGNENGNGNGNGYANGNGGDSREV